MKDPYLLRFGGSTGGLPRRPRWQAWLALTLSFAIGITLFLLAASLALVLIPIVLVVGAIAAWRLRSKLKAAGFYDRRPGPARKTPQDPDVVDAEYRIVEPESQPRR